MFSAICVLSFSFFCDFLFSPTVNLSYLCFVWLRLALCEESSLNCRFFCVCVFAHTQVNGLWDASDRVEDYLQLHAIKMMMLYNHEQRYCKPIQLDENGQFLWCQVEHGMCMNCRARNPLDKKLVYCRDEDGFVQVHKMPLCKGCGRNLLTNQK